MGTVVKNKGNATTPASKNIYAQAFRYMQGYIYLLDKDGILIDCNDRFLQLLGLDVVPEKEIGSLYKIMVERGMWTENQISLIKSTDINAILSQKPQLNSPELPKIDNDGVITYYQFSRIPLVDNDNMVCGLLVILNDVTEHKQTMAELDKIKSQLCRQTTPSGPSDLMDVFESRTKTTPPKILIVEDNPIAQKAAQSILMNHDCLVDIASTEAGFYDLFEPGKYDLVFMDIGLEGTSGYVMAKQLRMKEKDTQFHVPVIALTGFEADVVQFDCDYYQMEGVITKPLTAKQVKQIIQRYFFKINVEVTGLTSMKH